MPQANPQTIYESVTQRIVGELEAGRVPWVQSWATPDVAMPLGLPTNGATGNSYSDINILILWGAAIEGARRTQNWLTFKQALTLGGCVRKGEKGTAVVYADRFVPEKERERAEQTGNDPQAIPFLKRYTVFNADQCDGLPDELFERAAPLPECEAILHAGHRLAPWLAPVMVSRQETARPLLTPGEVMQLPVNDELVMVAGLLPIRAKKLRYSEDANFAKRRIDAPALSIGAVYVDRPQPLPADAKRMIDLARTADTVRRAHAMDQTDDDLIPGL